MAVQWAAETVLYMLVRMTDPLLNPDIGALYIHAYGDHDRRTSGKFDSLRTRYNIRRTLGSDCDRTVLFEEIDRYEAVIVGNIDDGLRQEIVGYCFQHGKKLLAAPTMTDILFNSAEKTVMGDALLYTLNTEGINPAYRALKRVLDAVLSALALIVLSPLLLLVALSIKLYDGGPVFYRQVRLTEGGRAFRLVKFRSMIVNAESVTGAVLAGQEDPRVTPVGRFIRATRMDELPQLWNILRGDMALVGPRPERPEFYEKYCAEYPEFAYRLKVRAGLTGYAQLYGKYNTTFEDKARLDMYYIQRASFLRDLQLIFYTLKIIFLRESTEGVSEPVAAGEGRERDAEPAGHDRDSGV